jgi:TatA/E family protein of Tat protein translocase
MGNIGFSELVVIFAIALLLFGGRKLPEVGRSIGSAIREFKKSMAGLDEPGPQAAAKDADAGKVDKA